MIKKDLGVFFYIHFLLIIMAFSSPFYVSWPVILFFIFLYYLQVFYVGNCLISRLEFKEKIRDTTFYSHYLNKLGFSINKTKLRLFVDYVIPWTILMVALVYQL